MSLLDLYLLFMQWMFRIFFGIINHLGRKNIETANQHELAMNESKRDEPEPIIECTSISFENENFPVESMQKTQLSSRTKSVAQKLMNLMDSYAKNSENWSIIHEEKEKMLKIYRNNIEKENNMCFKIVARIASTNADFICKLYWNPEHRKKWDKNCACNELVKRIDDNTQIVFFRTKPIWPASARDALLLNVLLSETDSFYNLCTDLPDYLISECSNSALLKPIDAVRMTVNLLGQKITVHPNEHYTEIVQIIDGSPNGWLPKNIIKLTTTKSIPSQLKMIEKLSLQTAAENFPINQLPVESTECGKRLQPDFKNYEQLEAILQKVISIDAKLDMLILENKMKPHLRETMIKTGGMFFGSLAINIIAYHAISHFFKNKKL